MHTWDELIGWYETLNNAGAAGIRSRVSRSMVQVLPSLRQSIEDRLPEVWLSTVMMALELHVPQASQFVVLQCVEEGKFILRIRGHQYEILEEIEADMSNVVEKTIECLEKSRQENLG